MARDVIENVPDYLQDFEDVSGICKALEAVIDAFYVSVYYYLRSLWFSNAGRDRWENIIKRSSYMGYTEDIAQVFLKKQTLVTMDKMTEYLNVWLKEGRFKWVYDKDTGVFKITTTLSESHVNSVWKMIRKMIPMNMALTVEYADEL